MIKEGFGRFKQVQNNNRLGLLLTGFIAIIIGIFLLDSLADEASTLDDIYGITNESIDIVSGVGTTAQDGVTQILFFGNGSNSTHQSVITIGVNVNITSKSEGTIVVGQNITNDQAGLRIFSNGNYNISYDYEGANYVADGTTRALIALTNIFYALAILLIGVVMVMVGFKDLNK